MAVFRVNIRSSRIASEKWVNQDHGFFGFDTEC